MHFTGLWNVEVQNIVKWVVNTVNPCVYKNKDHIYFSKVQPYINIVMRIVSIVIYDITSLWMHFTSLWNVEVQNIVKWVVNTVNPCEIIEIIVTTLWSALIHNTVIP
jgi:hypothetical protein